VACRVFEVGASQFKFSQYLKPLRHTSSIYLVREDIFCKRKKTKRHKEPLRKGQQPGFKDIASD